MPRRRPRPFAASALRTLAPLAAVVLGTLACGPAEAPPGDAVRVVHEHDDDRFVLVVAAEDAAEGRRVRAEVVPRGDYHLSLDYPSRFELAGRPAERREDAATLSEAKLAFETELPEAGATGRVPGRLRFGVCLRDELCEPVDHRFELEVD
jgi:hypothetical protein